MITPPPLTEASRAELTEAIARFRKLQHLPLDAAIHWTSSPDQFAADCSGWRRGWRTKLPPCRSYQRRMRRRHRVYWRLRQAPAVLQGMITFGFLAALTLLFSFPIPLLYSARPTLESTGVGLFILFWLLLCGWTLGSCLMLYTPIDAGWDSFRGRLTDEAVRSLRFGMPEFEGGLHGVAGLLIRSDAVTLYPSFRSDMTTGSGVPATDDHARDSVAELLSAYSVMDRYGVTCAFLRYLTVVLEPPRLLRVEMTPDGTRRLHGDPDPAVEWRDGTRWYALRGVRVDRKLITGDLTVRQIHELDNSEVRRIAIERKGWARYLTDANLKPVAEADDPANPGATLQLFDLPDSNVRILVMRNGSPDRSGELRTYAEPVPRHFDDPVAAAAWQYDCPTEVYRELRRRT